MTLPVPGPAPASSTSAPAAPEVEGSAVKAAGGERRGITTGGGFIEAAPGYVRVLVEKAG